jgi:hypothetical protein
MRVECEVDEVELESEDGRTVEGVQATCSRCDHQTESFGTSDRSVKRCLVLMREECPRNEENFYVGDDD